MPVARLLLFVSLGVAACQRATATLPPLPETAITDARYKNLVFLVATVRKDGTGFVITNGSTQPWFDATVVLAGAPTEYRVHIDEVDAGQTVQVSAAAFADTNGVAFDSVRAMPRTLIISAEIGEGGPTGVYAVRL
jgi:hypothetical protein